MPIFRIHFESGEKLDLTAANAALADAAAKEARKGELIRKIKLVKQEAANAR
jgi:hypothetical protein